MSREERLEAERAGLFDLLRGDAAALLERQSVELYEHLPHRRIYLAIAELVEAGESVDAAAVARAAGGERSTRRALAEILDDAAARLVWPDRHLPELRRIAAKRLGARLANGSTPEEMAALHGRIGELLADPDAVPRKPLSVDLADVAPVRPPMAVPDLIRESGLHLIYSRANTGKTWFKLALSGYMLSGAGETRQYLFESPELPIRKGWRGVLDVSTEESSSTQAWRWKCTCRGLGLEPGALRGLRFRWGLSEPQVTLDQLDQLIRSERSLGPVDAVLFDSVTALLPPTLDRVPIAWDADNFAVRRLCAGMRRVCEELHLAVFLIHHEGKDRERGSRGPSEWLNSPDVVIRLDNEIGGAQIAEGLRVLVEKQRDAVIRKPFWLERQFSEQAVTHRWRGAVTVEAKLSAGAKRADAFLAGKGEASQAEIEKGVKLHRNTVSKLAKECLEARLWEQTGRSTERGSPIYRRVTEEPES